MGAQKVSMRVAGWFGERDIELAFPSTWEVTERRMAGHDRPALTDQEMRTALRNPFGTPRLSQPATSDAPEKMASGSKDDRDMRTLEAAEAEVARLNHENGKLEAEARALREALVAALPFAQEAIEAGATGAVRRHAEYVSDLARAALGEDGK